MKKVCVMSVFLVISLFNVNAFADCPDRQFISPSGQTFKLGSTFNYKHMQCETNGSLLGRAEAETKSTCGGNWKNAQRADGCSIPVKGVKDVFNTVFHGACNLHDVCYSTPGNTKEECDKWLYQNMIETCTLPGAGSVGMQACTAAALSIYEGVALGGQESYDNDQKWAKKNCD